MEQSKFDFFVANNGKKLEADKLQIVIEKLKTVSDEKFALLQATSLTTPALVWVVSFFFGYLGIDRFMTGQIGLGVAKFLTAGGGGLWWLLDLAFIGKAVKENNFKKISQILM